LLFTAIAGAQDEYLRLSLPILPFVIILAFQFPDAVISILFRNPPCKSMILADPTESAHQK
jgi:hypothetical protein